MYNYVYYHWKFFMRSRGLNTHLRGSYWWLSSSYERRNWGTVRSERGQCDRVHEQWGLRSMPDSWTPEQARNTFPFSHHNHTIPEGCLGWGRDSSGLQQCGCLAPTPGHSHFMVTGHQPGFETFLSSPADSNASPSLETSHRKTVAESVSHHRGE